MARFSIEKAKLALFNLWMVAGTKSVPSISRVSKFNTDFYSSESTGFKGSHVPDDFVMMKPTLLASLAKREIDIVAKVCTDLKLYNTFWYFDYRTNRRDEIAISNLRKKGILIKTDVIDIHLINPTFLRRGEIGAVIAASAGHLEESKNGLSKKIIKNLKKPDKAFPNPFLGMLNASKKY